MGLRFASKITKIFAATTWLGIKKTKHSVNKSLGPHEIWRKEILLQSLGSKANRTLAMLTLRKIYAIGARLDELRSLYSAD